MSQGNFQIPMELIAHVRKQFMRPYVNFVRMAAILKYGCIVALGKNGRRTKLKWPSPSIPTLWNKKNWRSFGINRKKIKPCSQVVPIKENFGNALKNGIAIPH